MADTKPRSRANFDVGVLFYNRARQTLDCVLSFLGEEIQPDIVVLDQGSAAEQRKLLDEAFGSYPNVRITSLAENIGVAAARNRLGRECSSEWIMFVDNDVTLGTPGGVALINFAVTNADGVDGFCPRIMNIHENRFVDRLRLTEESGRLEIALDSLDSATINTFAGTAFVLRRSLLHSTPFDERYFVGFEDFDLALSAYKTGQPLRLRPLNDVIVVHKHMPVISEPDVTSTRTRYSIPLIAKGFDVFKTKHGGEPFGHWEAWVENQQQMMHASRQIAPRVSGDRVKITFVVDIPNWALDNVVRNLARDIGDDYVFTTVYAQQDDEPGQALRRLVESCPDIVHVMWRADFRMLVCANAVKQCAVLMELSETEIIDRLCQSHITFSVRDHLFLGDEDITAWRPLFWLSDSYFVISPIMLDIYTSIPGYPRPAAMIANGVDLDLYQPAEPISTRASSTMTIGWVGCSAWGEGQGVSDAKGLKSILRPAIETLRNRGVDVELLAIDRVERWLPREEVAALYPKMDIFVCAAAAEGTPNPVLEAMACGVPIVSTPVGIVSYLFGRKQKSFMVERSVEAFANALQRLCLDAELRKSLAQENLQQIKQHSWSSRTWQWRKFFVATLQSSHPDAPYWRRFMIEKFFLAIDKAIDRP